MILTKDQIKEYQAILFSSKDEAFGVALVDLLRHRLEKAKGELVMATDTVELFRWQGKADAYQSLLTALKVPPGTTPEV